MNINLFECIDISIKKCRNKKSNNDWFKSDYVKFKQLMGENSEFLLNDNHPCLTDKNAESGVVKGMYFHQDLFVAKQIFKRNPRKHVDIGSSVEGFVAHVASFRQIEIFDIRKLESNVENISFKQVDFMSPNKLFEEYCDSISSLNVIEHFGLGRYGDAIDPIGHLKGFDNITNILLKGGIFYFSVPMGKTQKVEFNAHRIFSLPYLIDWVTKSYEIDDFCYVDDIGDLHERVELNELNISTSFNCTFGCAIFILRKK